MNPTVVCEVCMSISLQGVLAKRWYLRYPFLERALTRQSWRVAAAVLDFFGSSQQNLLRQPCISHGTLRILSSFSCLALWTAQYFIPNMNTKMRAIVWSWSTWNLHYVWQWTKLRKDTSLVPFISLVYARKESRSVLVTFLCFRFLGGVSGDGEFLTHLKICRIIVIHQWQSCLQFISQSRIYASINDGKSQRVILNTKYPGLQTTNACIATSPYRWLKCYPRVLSSGLDLVLKEITLMTSWQPAGRKYINISHW